MIVNCPSGLVVELRKLKVAEANILADKQAQQKGATLDQLLSAVWVSTQDGGPYSFTGKPNWDEALAGDRWYAQLMVRIETHGRDYDFRIPCSVCKAVIDWTVNLDELPVKKLSAEDAATFRAGNKFTETGPDGKRYEFHLQTGKHERRAQQILKSNRTSRITAALLARIDEIEGVKDRHAYLNDLDYTMALDIVQMLDSHDCGLETDLLVVCEQCGAETEVSLPLDQPGYWSPTRKAMKSAT